MFALKYLYDNHRTVEHEITVGARILSLPNGDLVFKDSLCFLPFPLASFPGTFGLTEQCKGVLPPLIQHHGQPDVSRTHAGDPLL